jgi:hypothetical protein
VIIEDGHAKGSFGLTKVGELEPDEAWTDITAQDSCRVRNWRQVGDDRRGGLESGGGW